MIHTTVFPYSKVDRMEGQEPPPVHSARGGGAALSSVRYGFTQGVPSGHIPSEYRRKFAALAPIVEAAEAPVQPLATVQDERYSATPADEAWRLRLASLAVRHNRGLAPSLERSVLTQLSNYAGGLYDEFLISDSSEISNRLKRRRIIDNIFDPYRVAGLTGATPALPFDQQFEKKEELDLNNAAATVAAAQALGINLDLKKQARSYGNSTQASGSGRDSGYITPQPQRKSGFDEEWGAIIKDNMLNYLKVEQARLEKEQARVQKEQVPMESETVLEVPDMSQGDVDLQQAGPSSPTKQLDPAMMAALDAKQRRSLLRAFRKTKGKGLFSSQSSYPSSESDGSRRSIGLPPSLYEGVTGIRLRKADRKAGDGEGAVQKKLRDISQMPQVGSAAIGGWPNRVEDLLKIARQLNNPK